MDLIKIGKYIAGKRKDHGLTQRQLAEKLGMSDKSVSKWERGICLPDVSVYSDLCQILGISINEFLAGEDIVHEDLIQKSEENIIGIAAESKRKQSHLKTIIYLLLAISVLAISIIGVSMYRSSRPQNFIAPVEKDSIEMETAKLLSGPDGAYIYKFTTTDEYKSLKLYFSKYQSGVLQDKENMELGFADIDSPKYGEILLVPDFKRFVLKIIIAADGSKISTEIPILEDVTDTFTDLETRASGDGVDWKAKYEDLKQRAIAHSQKQEEEIERLKQFDLDYLFQQIWPQFAEGEALDHHG